MVAGLAHPVIWSFATGYLVAGASLGAAAGALVALIILKAAPPSAGYLRS
jgi:hypothetical protein